MMLFLFQLLSASMFLFQQEGLAFVVLQPNSKTTTARGWAKVPIRGKTTTGIFHTTSTRSYNNDDKRRSVVHQSALPSKWDSDESLVQNVSHTLKRTSWISWWGQVILTTVSTVTLFFARSVRMSDLSKRPVAVGGGLFLAGSGIALSILSMFWTWGGARLARRLSRVGGTTSRVSASTLMRRTISIAVNINLLGMLTTLIGAEQIVGMLATKVLTMQGVTPFGGGGGAVTLQTLQPLDILIVQANTNTLLSHFVSLVCALYLTRSVRLLDPPSVEGKPKRVL